MTTNEQFATQSVEEKTSPVPAPVEQVEKTSPVPAPVEQVENPQSSSVDGESEPVDAESEPVDAGNGSSSFSTSTEEDEE